MSHLGWREYVVRTDSLGEVYRTGGLLVITLGVVLVYFLAFTPFDEPVRRWSRPEEGSGFVQIKIECPDAWSALALGERVESHLITDRNQCLRSARTHATWALVVAGLAGVLGVRGVLRGPAPAPRPLRPLSELIRSRGGSSKLGR